MKRRKNAGWHGLGEEIGNVAYHRGQSAALSAVKAERVRRGRYDLSEEEIYVAMDGAAPNRQHGRAHASKMRAVAQALDRFGVSEDDTWDELLTAYQSGVEDGRDEIVQDAEAERRHARP